MGKIQYVEMRNNQKVSGKDIYKRNSKSVKDVVTLLSNNMIFTFKFQLDHYNNITLLPQNLH